MTVATDDPVARFVAAVQAGDAGLARQLLEHHPELRARIDDSLPGFPFDGTAMLAAVHQKNLALVDVLLSHGADINQKSRWWAGGFGVLDDADAPLEALLARGAVVDVHAAARHGLIDRLRALLDADPALVHARGGDGQTPLHAARTIAVAALLLERGAEIDATDLDHEGTPAQWMASDRPEVARWLVGRGARTDVLLAAALGDAALLERHLREHPEAIRAAVTPEWLSLRNPRAGGHIYNWSLDRNATLYQVARKFGHEDVARLIYQRSPDTLKLAIAARTGNEAEVRRLLTAEPGLAARLEPPERRVLVDAAQDDDAAAVRRLLDAGWPVDARGQEDGTALHWAAFHGNADTVRALLAHGADPKATESTYGGMPRDWASHGRIHGWRRHVGNYDEVSELLERALAAR